MKRGLMIIVGLVLGLPASALGATQYEGGLKGIPGSEFGFELAHDNGHRVARNVHFTDLPMTCEGGPAEYGVSDNTTARVRGDRRFKVKRDLGVGSSFRVAGRFSGDLEKATGTLKAKTQTMLLGDCSSEKVKWKADEQ